MKVPPVPPIGLEYLKTAIEKHEHRVKILDLCFSSTPEIEIKTELQNGNYDIIGFTIRNVDFGIYFNCDFYLPKIRKLVQFAKQFDLPVVLGGAGFSSMPREILEYLGADYGIVGPGEIAFPRFLHSWQENALTEDLIDGWKQGIDPNLIHRRGKDIELSRYLKEDGVFGFQTHFGCTNQCPYCVEANKKIWFRNIKNVVDELRILVKRGCNHFHLCDSEFNNDLSFSMRFCETLKESGISLKWALYMKPKPYSEKLYYLLSETNAYMITLSVDTDERIQSLNSYSYQDLENVINLCSKYKIQVSIDLMTGYPGESLDSTKKGLEFFKKHRPNQVGIGFYYRLAKNTPFTNTVLKDSQFHKNLTRMLNEGENLLEPIFYHHLEKNMIEDFIEGDELFSISGLKKGVNYQRRV